MRLKNSKKENETIICKAVEVCKMMHPQNGAVVIMLKVEGTHDEYTELVLSASDAVSIGRTLIDISKTP